MRRPLARARLALSALVLGLVLGGCGATATPAPTTGPGIVVTPGPTSPATHAPTGPATPIPVPTGTPLGDRLVATITVAAAPCAMAADDTSVWVTGNTVPELDRIDPATNAVADRITLQGAPCGIALGADGRIWVAELGRGSVVAVDPKTRAVTGRIDGIGPQLWDLKAGFGSIWVVDRTAKAVLRVDPATVKVRATIPVGPQPSGLAVMPDGVWVTDDIDGKVRRIDPAMNTVGATADVGGTPSWFADDGAANLLVAERGAGRVVALDPVTGVAAVPSDGWNEPLDGTVFQGFAWVPEGAGRRVGVFDVKAASAAVVRYALPGAINPFVAEPAFGDVWVLDYGGSTIWRISP